MVDVSAPSVKGRYCVLIPAFEADRQIGQLVRQTRQAGFPVVVVDDGSRDRTAAIASHEGALVISHLRNQGKGSALRTGFDYALREGYEGVVTMDGDGQHDPADIHQLVRTGELQHAGIVLGNRLANGAMMPHIRRWTNQLMSGMVSTVARQRIPDSQCGFRFIRKEVLQNVPLTSKRFEIETELIIGAAKRRWKIVSVPVRSIYDTHHRSHIHPLRETVRFFGVILRHFIAP